MMAASGAESLYLRKLVRDVSSEHDDSSGPSTSSANTLINVPTEAEEPYLRQLIRDVSPKSSIASNYHLTPLPSDILPRARALKKSEPMLKEKLLIEEKKNRLSTKSKLRLASTLIFAAFIAGGFLYHQSKESAALNDLKALTTSQTLPTNETSQKSKIHWLKRLGYDIDALTQSILGTYEPLITPQSGNPNDITNKAEAIQPLSRIPPSTMEEKLAQIQDHLKSMRDLEIARLKANLNQLSIESNTTFAPNLDPEAMTQQQIAFNAQLQADIKKHIFTTPDFTDDELMNLILTSKIEIHVPESEESFFVPIKDLDYLTPAQTNQLINAASADRVISVDINEDNAQSEQSLDTSVEESLSTIESTDPRPILLSNPNDLAKELGISLHTEITKDSILPKINFDSPLKIAEYLALLINTAKDNDISRVDMGTFTSNNLQSQGFNPNHGSFDFGIELVVANTSLRPKEFSGAHPGVECVSSVLLLAELLEQFGFQSRQINQIIFANGGGVDQAKRLIDSTDSIEVTELTNIPSGSLVHIKANSSEDPAHVMMQIGEIDAEGYYTIFSVNGHETSDTADGTAEIYRVKNLQELTKLLKANNLSYYAIPPENINPQLNNNEQNQTEMTYNVYGGITNGQKLTIQEVLALNPGITLQDLIITDAGIMIPATADFPI